MRTVKSALAALLALSLIGGTSALVQAQVETTAEPSDEGTELLPGLEFVTEEVEPGVHRVSSDGVRELAWPIEWVWFDAWMAPGVLIRANARDQVGIAASNDGVWLRRPEGILRLGQSEPVWKAGAGETAPKLTVTSDGELYRGQPLSTLREGEWQEVEVPRRFGIREIGSNLVAPDATMWLTGHNGLDGGKRRWQLLRHDADGWSRISRPPGFPASRPIPLAQAGAAPDGVLYVAKGREVWRFDGERWEAMGSWDSRVGAAMVAPDGTLWVELLERAHQTDDRVFLRADGDDWIRHEAGRELTDLANSLVAADGALWYTVSGDPLTNGACDGLARTDGTTTRHFLDDRCVHALAVGPEGTVWAAATWWFGNYFSPESVGPVEVFAIDPDSWSGAGV